MKKAIVLVICMLAVFYLFVTAFASDQVKIANAGMNRHDHNSTSVDPVKHPRTYERISKIKIDHNQPGFHVSPSFP